MTESQVSTQGNDESAGPAQEKAKEVAGQAQEKAQEAGVQARSRRS